MKEKLVPTSAIPRLGSMRPPKDSANSRRGLVLLGCLATLCAATGAGVAWPPSGAPDNPSPTVGAAKVLLARGDVTSAEAMLRQLNDPEARFLLGKFLANRGRWSEARTLLIASTSDSAHRTEALRLLAQGSMDHSDWAGALEFLRELEKADPKSLKVLKALALSLQKSGDALGALATAQRGLVVAPGDRELLTLMGEAAEASALSAARPRGPDGLPQPLRYGRRPR